MDYAPYVRIFLRYVVGAVFFSAQPLGETLAADPDLVMALSGAVGAIIEAAYMYARRKGRPT